MRPNADEKRSGSVLTHVWIDGWGCIGKLVVVWFAGGHEPPAWDCAKFRADLAAGGLHSVRSQIERDGSHHRKGRLTADADCEGRV